MSKSEYSPKWLYHKEHGPKLISSEAEEKALVGVWKDTPAAFEEPAKEEKPVGQKHPKQKESAE